MSTKTVPNRFEDEKSNGKSLKERLYNYGTLSSFTYNGLEKVPVYTNAPIQKHKFLKKKIQWQDMPDRFIISNIADTALPDNSISTTKYTPLTFIPKNLMEQFSKLANIYFLVSKARDRTLIFLANRSITDD